MKTREVLVMAGCILVLTGCVVTSVYPFYNQKDVLPFPQMAGTWTNTSEEHQTWIFEPDATNHYRVTYTEKDSTNVMDGAFFKIQQVMLLDLFNAEAGDVMPPPIPAHMLLRVSETNGGATMTTLNLEWLSKLLAENPKALRHHFIGDDPKPENRRLVLTAETAELQKFVAKYLGDTNAWDNAFELTKQTPAAAAK